jgi:hypothetical protein
MARYVSAPRVSLDRRRVSGRDSLVTQKRRISTSGTHEPTDATSGRHELSDATCRTDATVGRHLPVHRDMPLGRNGIYVGERCQEECRLSHGLPTVSSSC